MRLKDVLLHVVAVGLLFATMPAVAQVIEQYTYAPDKVYPVRTGLGITTQIELSPHEEILTSAPASAAAGTSAVAAMSSI